jgi:hypothetical protein
MLESDNIDELKEAVTSKNNNSRVTNDITTYIDVVYNMNNQVDYEDKFVEKLWELHKSDNKELSDIRTVDNSDYRIIWDKGIKNIVEDPGQEAIDINDNDMRNMRIAMERVYERLYQKY